MSDRITMKQAAEHLMADPDYSRMTDVERVAWLKGWDAAIGAEQRRVATLEDERDSFKRLMLVAGSRVAVLEKGLRRIANYDIGLPVEDESPIVFDYYRTIVRKARALLDAAPSDHDCLMPSACGVTGFYCANSRPAALPAEDEDIPEAFGRLVQSGPVSEASDE